MCRLAFAWPPRYNLPHRMLCLLLSVSLTLSQPFVLAQRQSKRPPKSAPKPAEPPVDDFDLLPKEAKPDPAEQARRLELDHKLALRRTMLNYHQLAGFVTLGSLTATAVLGQLDYLDKYGGHGDTGRWHLWHRWVAFTSAGIFAGTASLAVFAPVPIPKQTQLDRTTLHKVAMTVASAGMLTQIVLGIVTASAEGSLAQRNYALAHQIVGYTTVAASFVGFGFFVF
ncbi:MAG TPA: hypothetical protein VLW85_12605 [Myxococcales bacterium]|nr:hypothetical protein [Myxococcales bacterium]